MKVLTLEGLEAAIVRLREAGVSPQTRVAILQQDNPVYECYELLSEYPDSPHTPDPLFCSDYEDADGQIVLIQY